MLNFLQPYSPSSVTEQGIISPLSSIIARHTAVSPTAVVQAAVRPVFSLSSSSSFCPSGTCWRILFLISSLTATVLPSILAVLNSSTWLLPCSPITQPYTRLDADPNASASLIRKRIEPLQESPTL